MPILATLAPQLIGSLAQTSSSLVGNFVGSSLGALTSLPGIQNSPLMSIFDAFQGSESSQFASKIPNLGKIFF